MDNCNCNMFYYICIALIFVTYIIYKYLTKNFGYWERKNVPCLKPELIFGNMRETILMKKSLGLVFQDIYRAMPNESMVGFYRVLQPALLLRDPDLVKDVLVKQFDCFHDNDFQVDEKVDPMFGKNPFVLTGSRWKIVRGQLSPSFTAGKIKLIAPVIEEVSKNLIKYLEENENLPIDTKETSAKFTTDVIATCVFGLEGNSFTDPNAEFRKMGRLIIEPTLYNSIVQQIVVLVPIVANFLSIRIIPKSVEKWFRNTISKTVKYREENNITRSDFLQTLMELRHKPGSYEFTMDDVTSHSVLFFTDGFETSSTLLSFAFYELAHHLDIQNKLREEISSVLEKHNGSITYDAIQEMSYLEMVISETLRKYPPVPQANRLCTMATNIGPINVEKGTSVVIPTLALQYDEKYYPDPERFDPQRFTAENINSRSKYVYMPFGEGPRICLGIRLALTQSKIGLVSVIRDFDIRTCPETPKTLSFAANFLLSSKETMFVKFMKRIK